MDTILCAVDFSETSRGAAIAAAAIARRLGGRLVLAHVRLDIGEARVLADPSSGEFARGLATRAAEVTRAEIEADRERLRALAAELGAKDAAAVVEIGPPAKTLLEIARRESALLIVAGTHGRSAPARWFLGSVAEELVTSTPRPLLVVRDAGHVKAWTSPKRAIECMVAIDPSDASRGAIRFGRLLEEMDGFQCRFASSYWPPAEAARLGIPTLDPETEVPKIEAAVASELRAKLPDIGDAKLSLLPSWGRAPDAIELLAEKEGMDLVVVGTRSLSPRGRGLFALRVVRTASMPVLCVPATWQPPKRPRAKSTTAAARHA